MRISFLLPLIALSLAACVTNVRDNPTPTSATVVQPMPTATVVSPAPTTSTTIVRTP
ncbi:MAG: hypothetical protein WDN25_12250 [Acetobacteraceae bacterium]